MQSHATPFAITTLPAVAPARPRRTRSPAAIAIASTIALAFLTLIGCVARSSSPYAPQAAPVIEPSTRAAEALTRQAADLAGIDPVRAESLLRQALVHDLYHGPAHNNLGTLHLSRGHLYEAASEFEWARKLMPGHPDPRLNLAITLERAGRTDEAVESYRAALEVAPGHLGAAQALTSLQLRTGHSDDQTIAHLRDIAMRGDPTWRAWARRHLSTR